MSRTDHAQRTASDPRDDALHTVVIRQVDQVNDRIRLFRLEIPDGAGPIKFLPGQWLDTYLPGLPRPGGFTITCPPSAAVAARGPSPSGPYPHLELAVQSSPDNPAAQFLWRDPPSLLLGTELRVRVGGSFVWPPPLAPAPVERAVFVAGGVGVNPLMSMVSHLATQPPEERQAREVRFLYSMRDPGAGRREASRMLFLERLAGLFRAGDGEGEGRLRGQMRLFLTGGEGVGGGIVPCPPAGDLPFRGRRISHDDLSEAVGDDKESAVVYICGLPTMTDEFVEWLTSPEGLGMARNRVLCEKWW